MAHTIPLNVIFTIPFNTQHLQRDDPHQPCCSNSTGPHHHSSRHESRHESNHDSHRVSTSGNTNCQHAAPHHGLVQPTPFYPSLGHQGAHGRHSNSHPCSGRHHKPDYGQNGWRPSGRPLLLAMSIDSKTLAVADSLHMISIFNVASADEKLTLTNICQKPSSEIAALAITEGGHTVLFVEKCAPAVLKMFHVSNPTKIHEISPVHRSEKAQVVSCSISSHFILASFYSDNSTTGTLALWRRKRNRIDSKLTRVFSWPAPPASSKPYHCPVYVTEWQTRRNNSEYCAEVAYHVDDKLVFHPEVGNKECESPSVIPLDQTPISIRIDQSHGRDCVYILTRDQLQIYRVNNGQLCLSDSVILGNGVCNSAVCGIWEGRQNRHVTVARIVHEQVLVFRAPLPHGVRFQL